MLQTCMIRSTLPPGPCDKAILGYHRPLENGNPSPFCMAKVRHRRPSILQSHSLPYAHQQSPFPAKLEHPVEGDYDHAEKQ
jgi:hypothetical protein